MSKHRERVQFRRKIAARNADKTSGALMDIYRRATQGGSEGYLVVNQESEPERVAKIQREAQERRDRRGNKERTLRPRKSSPTASTPKPTQYTRLQSGQIVGNPRLMRAVKTEARRTRLQRRANFRIEKRFAAITQAVNAN